MRHGAERGSRAVSRRTLCGESCGELDAAAGIGGAATLTLCRQRCGECGARAVGGRNYRDGVDEPRLELGAQRVAEELCLVFVLVAVAVLVAVHLPLLGAPVARAAELLHRPLHAPRDLLLQLHERRLGAQHLLCAAKPVRCAT